jgi:TPR repeat protein
MNEKSVGGLPQFDYLRQLNVRLVRPSTYLLNDVTLATRFRAPREITVQYTDAQQLRLAAENREPYAMEQLGLLLLSGDAAAGHEAFEWLREAASLGDPIAMVHLAACLLDDEPSESAQAEATSWLLKAIEHGYPPATIALGSCLITGNGVTPDVERGVKILREAARVGSEMAHLKLAIYFLAGWGMDRNEVEGLSWLRRVDVTDGERMSKAGHYLYCKSLAACTERARRTLAEEAAVLFQEAVRQGYREAGISLAYLLRRGELAPELYPPLGQLTAEHLHLSHPFALINQALRLAKGFQCKADWHAADAVVARIRDGNGLLLWWHARSEEGDPEGHLVTAWLCRHRLVGDPNGLTLDQRVQLARAGGWDAPEWMATLA